MAITVDARGHGDSEWVSSQNYTFEHYSDDLVSLTTEVNQRYGSNGGSPVLVGASMGGISAMMAQAGDVPSGRKAEFSAIVLVDITPRMEPTGVDKILGFMSRDMRAGFADVQSAADAIAEYIPGRNRPKSLNGLSKNLRPPGRWSLVLALGPCLSGWAKHDTDAQHRAGHDIDAGGSNDFGSHFAGARGEIRVGHTGSRRGVCATGAPC